MPDRDILLMHLASAPRADRRSPAHPFGFALAIGLYAAGLASPSSVLAASVIGSSVSGGVLVSTAGTDTTSFAGSRRLTAGRGYAQTFVARDTVLRSVAVWLPSWQRVPKFGLHLWITRAGNDGRPHLDEIVADGGTVTSGAGEGMTAARFQFDFLPALYLPARGRYALVVVAERCGVLDVLTSARRSGDVGDLWETSLRGCSNGPGARGARAGDDALAFRVEFYDLSTAAQGRTWGDIKNGYR